MTRYFAAAVVAGSLAADAPAQFLPFGGYGRQAYNWGYSPAGYGSGGYGFNYGGLSFQYYQTRQFSYSYNNPFLGYSGAVDLRFNYFGATPLGGYGGYGAYPVNPYAAAYLSGGVGAYGPAVNPIVQQQQQLLAAAAPAPRAGGNADNRLVADPAMGEFGRPAGRNPGGARLDPALAEPTDAALLSGETLNALHAAIRPLLEKRKGEPPVFPGEVLARLRFDGPAAADVVGWVRDGKLTFPAGPAFDKLKDEVEKSAAELLEDAAQGRKAGGLAADRVAVAVKQFRTAQADALRGLGVGDAMAASRFLAGLAALAEAGRDGSLTSFYPAKWATGANAAELLGHMDRLKLTFGPAGPGDDEAYAAAHRGLAGYCLSLAAKR